MLAAMTLPGLVVTWNPFTRVFDYRAEDPAAAGERHAEESLARWIRAASGGQPYGIVVDATGEVPRRSPSGFSLAEMLRERGRAHVACIGLSDAEAFALSAISMVTGVPIRAFPDRAGAEAWLRAALGPEIDLRASATTSP